MSFTQTQIDNAFDALGLALPGPGELNALEHVSDYYQGVQDIVALPEVQAEVAPIVQMFEAAFGRAPSPTTLASMVSSPARPLTVSWSRAGSFPEMCTGAASPETVMPDAEPATRMWSAPVVPLTMTESACPSPVLN